MSPGDRILIFETEQALQPLAYRYCIEGTNLMHKLIASGKEHKFIKFCKKEIRKDAIGLSYVTKSG